MKKLSVFKGILIGGLFSALFWTGVFFAATQNETVETPQEQYLPSQPQAEVPTRPIA